MNTYEINELNRHHAELARIESSRGSERAEGRKDAAERLTDAERVAKSVDWLLNGSYGHGAYLAAHNVLGNPRMNRAAWYAQMVCCLDCSAHREDVRAEYNKLTPAQQDALTRAVEDVIKSWEKEKVTA